MVITFCAESGEAEKRCQRYWKNFHNNLHSKAV